MKCETRLRVGKVALGFSQTQTTRPEISRPPAAWQLGHQVAGPKDRKPNEEINIQSEGRAGARCARPFNTGQRLGGDHQRELARLRSSGGAWGAFDETPQEGGCGSPR